MGSGTRARSKFQHVVLLGSLILTVIVPAEDALAQVGRITGVVTDPQRGDSLPGVTVYLEGTELGAVTSANGRFHIPNIPVGTYTVTVELPGYQTKRVEGVFVAIDQTVRLDFQIVTQAIAVDSIATDETAYTIWLRTDTIVTTEAERDSLVDFARDSVQEMSQQGITTHWYVQFDAIPSITEKQALIQNGMQLLSYLNGQAYAAAIGRTNVLDAPATFGIRWIGGIETKHKLHPDVLHGEFAEQARVKADGAPTDSVRLIVIFFRDASLQQMQDILSRHVRVEGFLGRTSWRVVADTARITSLAREDPVRYVRQVPPPQEPLNDKSRSAVKSEAVQRFDASHGTPVFHGLTGKGVRVAVMEVGVKRNHPDLESNWMKECSSHTELDHATEIAGVIASTGEHSGTDRKYRGHAPEAELCSYVGDWTELELDLADAVTGKGVDIANYSKKDWDESRYSEYNASAEAIDGLIWEFTHDEFNGGSGLQPHLYVTTAAGNKGELGEVWGYFSITGSRAKNVLSVGNYSTRYRERFVESSMGPTFDGRLKPDVMAPGHRIMTTTVGNNYDDDNTGTSYSAPVVAAVIALMLESHAQVTPDGPPINSTMKAVLLHTAVDLVRVGRVPADPRDIESEKDFSYHAGLDWATGYGLIDAKAATELIADLDSWLEAEIADVNEMHEYEFLVPSGADKIKSTLAWDDEPGDQTTPERCEGCKTRVLKNDLDLLLLSPTGRRYRPQVLDPLTPGDPIDPYYDGNDSIPVESIMAAVEGRDSLNNAEQVLVRNPRPGRWRARVTAHSLDGARAVPQRYSLVIPSKTGSIGLALSLHGGLAIPFATLAKTTDLGPTVNLDLVYAFTPEVWGDVRAGYSLLYGSASAGNVDIWNLSTNVRFNPFSFKPWPFVNGGLGLYHVRSLEGGFNVGGGLGYPLGSKFDIEATFNYHHVFTTAPDVAFAKVQLGFIWWP